MSFGAGAPLAVMLRAGNAGSNNATDHITVIREALRQLPFHRRSRSSRKVLTRIDGVYELAARFGIHRVTVSAHLHRRGVTLRHQGLDDEGVNEAIRLYEGGWSLARIGDRLGVDA